MLKFVDFCSKLIAKVAPQAPFRKFLSHFILKILELWGFLGGKNGMGVCHHSTSLFHQRMNNSFHQIFISSHPRRHVLALLNFHDPFSQLTMLINVSKAKNCPIFSWISFAGSNSSNTNESKTGSGEDVRICSLGYTDDIVDVRQP